jgi:hypothetical protein
MNAMPQLPSRYALILDPTAIRKALKKVESLNLPRRECRPLDRYTGPKASLDLARFDEDIDRDMELMDENMDDGEDLAAQSAARAAAPDDEWDDEPRH